MCEPFFRLLFPPRYRVLGYELPPLSLWHVAALEAIGSPLLSPHGETRIELGDLQAAVRICQTRWPDQPDMRPRLVDWWQQLRHKTSLRYLRTHAEAFHAYFALHCTPPELWEDEGVPRLLTAPSILSRVAGLAALPAFTLDSIWNDVTPGYALWLLCAKAERETGNVRFVTEEDAEDDANPQPHLETRPDAELYEIAKRELGEAAANTWLAARIENRKKGTLYTIPETD